MVSYDPFTPPLLPTMPRASPSPASTPLATPPALPTDIPSKGSRYPNSEPYIAPTAGEFNWHELDGAQICDQGSCVGSLEPEPFHIIPLLEGPPISPIKYINTPEQNDFLDFDSEAKLSRHSTNQSCETCERCGLNRTTSAHQRMRHAEESAVTVNGHRQRPAVPAISSLVPDIEAAFTCPDIHSPSSPDYDRQNDPFEAYQEHGRQHRRQGSSHLRMSSFTAETEVRVQNQAAGGTGNEENFNTNGWTYRSESPLQIS